MKFSKIKYNGEKVRLTWTEKKDGAELEHNLTSVLAPAPDLPKALEEFKAFVEELLEVPRAWMESATVTGLSINEEDDGRSGLVITSLKKIKNANGPVVVNTPHLRESQKPSEQGPGFFLDGMERAIARAEEAAAAFVAGKRAQRDLFKTEGAKDKKQLELMDGGKPPKKPRGRHK